MGGLVSFLFLLIVVITLLSIAKGAPYVPTDKKTLHTMLKLAGSVDGKQVIDLGSGDGRVALAFLEKGAKVTGYEINPLLYLISLVRLGFSPHKRLARMYLKSFWKADLSHYDVIVVFGISYIMSDLAKKIKKEARKGTRVISHAYEFNGWKHVKKEGAVYLYTI